MLLLSHWFSPRHLSAHSQPPSVLAAHPLLYIVVYFLVLALGLCLEAHRLLIQDPVSQSLATSHQCLL